MKWDPNDQSGYVFEATVGVLISFRLCMKRIQNQLWQDHVDVNQIDIFEDRRAQDEDRHCLLRSFLVVQLHDQEAILEVEGHPDRHGMPSPNQLFKAEQEFRSRFDRRYLISYESGPADGSPGRFSEYRAYLTAR